MKKISRFDSQPLSINPDLAHPAASGNRSTTSFRTLVLSASFLGALAVAIVACSKEAHKPAVSTSIVPATAQQPIIPAQAAPSTPVLPETKPAKKAAKHRPTKVTYKNATYGIAFQYPRRYSLKTGDEAIVDWFGAQPAGMNFVDQGGIAVAAVELPRGLYPGTDYRDGFFAVSVNRNLSAEQCSQFAVVDTNDSDEEPVVPSNVNFGGQVYSQTSTFEGHAFEQSYGHYYHVYNNGACYEMALDLETAGYGAVDGITPVDRDEVFHRLESMLASVRLQSAEPNREPQPALATAPASTATSDVAESAGTH